MHHLISPSGETIALAVCVAVTASESVHDSPQFRWLRTAPRAREHTRQHFRAARVQAHLNDYGGAGN